jgi:hypothetical protein
MKILYLMKTFIQKKSLKELNRKSTTELKLINRELVLNVVVFLINIKISNMKSVDNPMVTVNEHSNNIKLAIIKLFYPLRQTGWG